MNGKRFINTEDETMPAGAVMEATGEYDDLGFMKVRKVTTDNATNVFFNGPGEVASSYGLGECYTAYPEATAATNPADYPLALRQTIGAKASQWLLDITKFGFRVIGQQYNDMATVQPDLQAAGDFGWKFVELTAVQSIATTPGGGEIDGDKKEYSWVKRIETAVDGVWKDGDSTGTFNACVAEDSGGASTAALPVRVGGEQPTPGALVLLRSKPGSTTRFEFMPYSLGSGIDSGIDYQNTVIDDVGIRAINEADNASGIYNVAGIAGAPALSPARNVQKLYHARKEQWGIVSNQVTQEWLGEKRIVGNGAYVSIVPPPGITGIAGVAAGYTVTGDDTTPTVGTLTNGQNRGVLTKDRAFVESQCAANSDSPERKILGEFSTGSDLQTRTGRTFANTAPSGQTLDSRTAFEYGTTFIGNGGMNATAGVRLGPVSTTEGVVENSVSLSVVSKDIPDASPKSIAGLSIRQGYGTAPTLYKTGDGGLDPQYGASRLAEQRLIGLDPVFTNCNLIVASMIYSPVVGGPGSGAITAIPCARPEASDIYGGHSGGTVGIMREFEVLPGEYGYDAANLIKWTALAGIDSNFNYAEGVFGIPPMTVPIVRGGFVVGEKESVPFADLLARVAALEARVAALEA